MPEGGKSETLFPLLEPLGHKIHECADFRGQIAPMGIDRIDAAIPDDEFVQAGDQLALLDLIFGDESRQHAEAEARKRRILGGDGLFISIGPLTGTVIIEPSILRKCQLLRARALVSTIQGRSVRSSGRCGFAHAGDQFRRAAQDGMEW